MTRVPSWSWRAWSASARAAATTSSSRRRSGLATHTTTNRQTDHARRASPAGVEFLAHSVGACAIGLLAALAEATPEQVGRRRAQPPVFADAPLGEQRPAGAFGLAGDAVVAVLGFAFGDVLHQQPPARAQRGQFLGKLDLALARLFAGNPALAPGHRTGHAAAAPQHAGAEAAVGDAPRIARRGRLQRHRIAAAAAHVAPGAAHGAAGDPPPPAPHPVEALGHPAPRPPPAPAT